MFPSYNVAKRETQGFFNYLYQFSGQLFSKANPSENLKIQHYKILFLETYAEAKK